MLEIIEAAAAFPPGTTGTIIGFALLAGIVRGFTGFALSAVMFAGVVTIIPPVQLIPITFMLEGIASIIMFRGGIKDADMNIVWGLVITSTIGVPIGLYVTTSIDPEISKLASLGVILVLTLAQLFQVRISGLASRPGLYASGLVAGFITGISSVGGMVVALYVLAQQTAARRMRAALVMYLFIGMFTSLVYLSLYGILNFTALWRGVVLTPFLLSGVLLGTYLFRPSLEKFYKLTCLVLLVALCAVGLMRQLM